MNTIRGRVESKLQRMTFPLLHHARQNANRRFYKKHHGQRCFILCNGPSVLKQNLLPLRNEVVMSVSSGYLHKDYMDIGPAYHFLPSLTYGLMTEQDFVAWFNEMDEKLGKAEVFLASTEYQLVKRHSLFAKRTVNYLHTVGQFEHVSSRIIDITGTVPVIGSAPIMCLIAALYMGFKEIYLLGTDHDSLITREYKYSFEPTLLKGKDPSVDNAGKIRVPLYDELKAYLVLWEQYRHVKSIAQENGICIYNASAGGILDEFPRVELEKVLG